MRRWITLLEAGSEATEGSAPGVWYHGTPYAFDGFDVDAGEFESAHDTPAIFLTNDPSLAEAYASRERAPMAEGIPWAEMKRDFIEPANRLIRSSNAGAARFLANRAEAVVNGELDFEAVLDALPDVAAALGELRKEFEARMLACRTTPGANIRPCTVQGRFMHIHMVEHFHGGMYDLCLAQAKAAGLAGVVFHGVVDTPSGQGDPANVLAVFDPASIRPKFGRMSSIAETLEACRRGSDTEKLLPNKPLPGIPWAS